MHRRSNCYSQPTWFGTHRQHATLISGVPSPPPCVYLFTEFSVLTSTPLLHHSSRSNRALPPLRPPPSRRGWPQPVQPRVALPIYRVGADTDRGSQRPIQSLAYEISSSAVIPYTSSAYSHIQNPVFTSCLCEIEEKLGTDRVGVFLLVFKRVFVTADRLRTERDVMRLKYFSRNQ